MRRSFKDIAPDDGIEIISPPKMNAGPRCSTICLCCEQANQPMDDDGCGICDACLGLPARAVDNPDGLEFPSVLPHLSLTFRNR
jgi:hypothetical protein